MAVATAPMGRATSTTLSSSFRCARWTPSKLPMVSTQPEVDEFLTPRLLDSLTPQLKFQLQPVVSQSHVRRKLGVGFLVSQLVSDVRAVASRNSQPLHHAERLLNGQVSGVGPGP